MSWVTRARVKPSWRAMRAGKTARRGSLRGLLVLAPGGAAH
jgi:hypothetical protein